MPVLGGPRSSNMKLYEDGRLTFRRLARLEPGLLALEQAIKRLKPDSPRWCANRCWYEVFERWFDGLVGWNAYDPSLRSEAAYNLAFDHLYSLMPGCCDCDCL
jgi:hypothetical protein